MKSIKEVRIGENYMHYKGSMMKVLDVVRHSETLEYMVYYIHLDNGTSWVRPIDMFLETIEKDGKIIPRFKHIDTKEEE